MEMKSCILRVLVTTGLLTTSLRADDRRFTYTYEPETPAARTMAFENWTTLGAQRGAATGEANYRQWDLRQEFEYGVTDKYAVGLYLNEQATAFRKPGMTANDSHFDWKGVSLENRYNLLNPAEHAIGVTLYLEGTYSGSEAELEQKVIIGQRHGNWKWAFNLIHATGWEEDLKEREGELGGSFGLARDLGKHWSLGFEMRDETLIPDYKEFESTAVFLGPVVSYHNEKWWAALTAMGQIYGWNNDGLADGNRHLELVDHEKFNVRLLFGFGF